MMIKALLALALTVNLAASITCYSGWQMICASPCSSYSDMVSMDSDACTTETCGTSYMWNADKSTWDTCMSYTYSNVDDQGHLKDCACEQLNSIFWDSSWASLNGLGVNATWDTVVSLELSDVVYEGVAGCPHMEANVAGYDGYVAGTYTCTACATDNCNQDATAQDITEVVASESGAGSLYASRTLACLSSFAVALLLCRLF